MPIRGEATAVLDGGKILTLKVNFATLARAAAQVGIPAQDLFKVLQSGSDARQMLAMLALLEHAVKKHHPALDEDAIGDLMLTDGEAIGAALNAAVAGAFGEADQAETNENPPKKRGPGTRSKSGGRKRV